MIQGYVVRAEDNAVLYPVRASTEITPAEGEMFIESSLSLSPDDVYFTSSGTIEQKPMRPGAGFYWDNPSRGWVFVLELARRNHWNVIKSARDAALTSPFTWNFLVFDGDEKSQARIQGAVQLAQLALQSGQPFTITWTLADNSSVTLSAQDIVAVGLAMGARYQEVFSRGRMLRNQIDAATTQAELDAVIW